MNDEPSFTSNILKRAGANPNTAQLCKVVHNLAADIKYYNGIEFVALPERKAKYILGRIEFLSETIKEIIALLHYAIALEDTINQREDHFNIRGYSLPEKKQFITEIFFAAKEKHGHICLAVIDGIADFISSVNDEVEANAIVDFFDKLAIQYDCHIIVVLHFNPGTGKGRGHLGSQLERKSESILTIKKEDDAGVIEASHLRSGGLADFPPLRFKFDKDKGYHVFIESETVAHKEQNLADLAQLVLSEPRSATDAINLIKESERCQTRKASDILASIHKAGLTNRVIRGKHVIYELKSKDTIPF